MEDERKHLGLGGATMLHGYIDAWDAAGLRAALEQGADVNERNEYGQPPLAHALVNFGEKTSRASDAAMV